MTRDDVMRETLKHVRRVGNLVLDVVDRLQRRAMRHDDSKFSENEFTAFAEETPKLRELTYNSPEYHAATARLGPALEHHYANNDHHPQYHAGGVSDMDLIQLLEMLCDWKAATERHADGDLVRSIRENAKRFGYSSDIENLLWRTARNLGWLNEAQS